MKKSLFLICISLFISFNTFSQSISTKLFEPSYSDEVLKAKKKGSFHQLGYFGESTGDKFYVIAAYKPKKAEDYTCVVHTFDLDGKEIASTSFPMNDSKQEIEKLNLTSIRLFDKTTSGELQEITKQYKNQEVAIIKNPTLAGKPTIERGKLNAVYRTIGGSEMFERFQFELEEQYDIEDRFWNSVAFPLNNKELVIGKTDYLTNKRKSDMNLLQSVGEIFYDANRSAMLPAKELTYVGGVKATNALTTYLSGTMDLQTGEWKSKNEIETSEKIGDRNHNAILLPDGNIAIQLTLFEGKEEDPGFIVLIVDETGKEIRQQRIIFKTNSGKKMFTKNPLLFEIENGYINIATLSTTFLTKPHFGFSKTSGGKEVVNEVYSIEQLAESAILPAKMKFKANKIKTYETTKIEEKDGGYLVAGKITMSSNEGFNSIIDLSSEGVVSAIYIYPIATYPDLDMKELPLSIEGVKNLNELKVDGYKDSEFIQMENGEYYVVNGMKFNLLDKGINEEASFMNVDFWGTKTFEVSYFRVDYDRTFVGVTKVDFDNKTISNTVVPSALINGDEPGYVLKNGALYFDSDSKLVLVQ